MSTSNIRGRSRRGARVVSIADFQNHDIYTVLASTITEMIKSGVDSKCSIDPQTVFRLIELVGCFGRLSECSTALSIACRVDATFDLYVSFIYHAHVSMHGNASAIKISTRFYDGFRQTQLLTGSTGVGPHENMHRFNALGVKDIVQDRFKTAKKLCQMEIPEISNACRKYVPTDIPTGTGRRAAAFLGRARLLSQHAASNNPSLTCNCGYFNCMRPMLNIEASGTASSAHGIQPSIQDVFGVHPPAANGSNAFDDNSSDDEDDDTEVNAPPSHSACHGYWASVCPGVVTTLPLRKFCSLVCFKEYTSHLRNVLPVSAYDVESYESTYVTAGKVGLSRISSACRAAFKRNTAIARTLRITKRKGDAGNIVTEDLATRIHSNIIDMLNVDLAILFAAAYIAESPSASIARILPATYDDWRSEWRKWSRAIEVAKSVYIQHSRGGKVLAYDETQLPMWLSKVREKATIMFPVQSLE